MLNQVNLSKNVSFGVAYHIQKDTRGVATRGLAKKFNEERINAMPVVSTDEKPSLVATGDEFKELSLLKKDPTAFEEAVDRMSSPNYPNSVNLGGEEAWDRCTGSGHQIDLTEATNSDKPEQEICRTFGCATKTILYGYSGSVAYSR